MFMTWNHLSAITAIGSAHGWQHHRGMKNKQMKLATDTNTIEYGSLYDEYHYHVLYKDLGYLRRRQRRHLEITT